MKVLVLLVCAFVSLEAANLDREKELVNLLAKFLHESKKSEECEKTSMFDGLDLTDTCIQPSSADTLDSLGPKNATMKQLLENPTPISSEATLEQITSIAGITDYANKLVDDLDTAIEQATGSTYEDGIMLISKLIDDYTSKVWTGMNLLPVIQESRRAVVFGIDISGEEETSCEEYTGVELKECYIARYKAAQPPFVEWTEKIKKLTEGHTFTCVRDDVIGNDASLAFEEIKNDLYRYNNCVRKSLQFLEDTQKTLFEEVGDSPLPKVFINLADTFNVASEVYTLGSQYGMAIHNVKANNLDLYCTARPTTWNAYPDPDCNGQTKRFYSKKNIEF